MVKRKWFVKIKVAWCGARRGGADLRLIIGCFFAESKTSTSNNAKKPYLVVVAYCSHFFFPALWMRSGALPVKSGFPFASRKGASVVHPSPVSHRPRPNLNF